MTVSSSQDPAQWTGAELELRDDWILHLQPDLLADFGDAAGKVAASLDGEPSNLLHLPKGSLPLDVIEELVADIRSRLGDELGFVLVRGLPVDSWDDLTLLTAYWMLGSAVGRPLANNPTGDMMGHVANLGRDIDHPQHRAYQTSASLYFHTDQCDVVSLLCLRAAKSGGLSKVASSVHAYHVMVDRHPELAERLTEPLRWSRMGEVGPGQDGWYPAPVFAVVDGRVSVSTGPKHIEKGHALPGAPPLPAETRQALEVLNDLAEEFHLTMAFEPGDIQFLNNAVCLHSRTGFDDWPDPTQRRLLWRLWINVDGLRPRAPYYQQWQDGIWAPDDKKTLGLEPAW